MRDIANVVKGLLLCRPNIYVSFEHAADTRPVPMRHESVPDRLDHEVEVQRCREIVVNVGKRFVDDDADISYADLITFTHFANAQDDNLRSMPCDDTDRSLSLRSGWQSTNENNAIMKLVLLSKP
jgi:hypothetical protein